MPNSATVEEVRDAYIKAFKHNLKGVTVYRDGCKTIQVLDTGKKEETKEIIKDLTNEEGFIIPMAVAPIMPSLKIKQKTPFGHMHANITLDPISGRPFEVFAQLGKSGDIAHADLEAICRLISTSLRANINPQFLVEQLEGIGSTVSSGFSREGEITSLGDALSRVLKKYLMAIDKHGIEKVLLGKVDFEHLAGEMCDDIKKGKNEGSSFGIKCPDCKKGSLIFEEGCKKCPMCNYSAC